MRITRRDALNSYNALAQLSQRTLPDSGSDDKVAKLLRRLKGVSEDIGKARDGSMKRYPTPDGSERTPADLLEKREFEFGDYLRGEEEIRDIPATLQLSEANMPKAIKLKSGEMDETNRAGLAGIKADLGEHIFILEDKDETS